MPSVTELGDGAFMIWLGHENSALLNGISGLIGVRTELPGTFQHIRIHGLLPERGPSPDHVSNLIWDFLLLINYEACGILL